jgi:hypothetical protein
MDTYYKKRPRAEPAQPPPPNSMWMGNVYLWRCCHLNMTATASPFCRRTMGKAGLWNWGITWMIGQVMYQRTPTSSMVAGPCRAVPNPCTDSPWHPSMPGIISAMQTSFLYKQADCRPSLIVSWCETLWGALNHKVCLAQEGCRQRRTELGMSWRSSIGRVFGVFGSGQDISQVGQAVAWCRRVYFRRFGQLVDLPWCYRLGVTDPQY